MKDTKKLRELLDMVNATFMVYEKEADFYHGWETKREATQDLYIDFAKSVCELGDAMITVNNNTNAVPMFGLTIYEPATEVDLNKIIMSSGVATHHSNN